MKKFVFLSFIFLLSIFLLQCSENPLDLAENQESGEDFIYKKGGNGSGGGPGGGGGGGGHTTTQGNNLSFPALLADGYSVTPIALTTFDVIYSGVYTELSVEQIQYLIENGPWYPQQTEGNVWQADFATVSSVDLDWIDWGDAIEAVNPKIRRPYRLELVLYEAVTGMNAYTMAELEFPSSKNELQGTNTTTYLSNWATVASLNAHIVVQRFEGINPGTLTWNAALGKWDGAEAPVTGFGFMVENNVGGKLIYGASQGGWRPNEFGAHRITFYLDASVVNLSTAGIGNYSEGTITEVIQGETNTPIVDVTNNLTYVDVTVVQTGGGGGH